MDGVDIFYLRLFAVVFVNVSMADMLKFKYRNSDDLPID